MRRFSLIKRQLRRFAFFSMIFFDADADIIFYADALFRPPLLSAFAIAAVYS